MVGDIVGLSDSAIVGNPVGLLEGTSVGALVVGESVVGDMVSVIVGLGVLLAVELPTFLSGSTSTENEAIETSTRIFSGVSSTKIAPL